MLTTCPSPPPTIFGQTFNTLSTNFCFICQVRVFLMHDSTLTFIHYMLWLPGVARDDSNEVLKRVFSLKFSLMNKVCWDSQTSLTLFTHPIPRGGVLGQKKPRTFLPSRTTSVPNFIAIRPAGRISIENTHTHKPTLSFI